MGGKFRRVDAIVDARPQGILRRLAMATRRPTGTGVRPVYSLIGGCMSLRAGMLAEIGGFNPRIRFGGPETNVCIRLRARYGDACLLADPALVVPHEYEARLASTFRRAWRAGRGAGRDWAWRGGLPAVRPAPALVAAAAVAAALPGLVVPLLADPALPVLAGLGVALWAWGGLLAPGTAESLAYPLLAAAEEAVHDAGVLAGWRAHRGERPPEGM